MQWYQINLQLQEIEIKRMKVLYPDAKLGYLPNGQMYWILIVHPIIFGEKKEWTILAVYDFDHPHKKWGGSVKIYPVKPNYNEMKQKVINSSVAPKEVSHLISDDYGQPYLASCVFCRCEEYKSEDELVTSAVTQIRYALRWITIFEVGLVEQKVWSIFSGTGYGNTYEYICRCFSDIPEIKQLS